MQPTSGGFDQDIESILGMIHSPSSGNAPDSSLNVPRFEFIQKTPGPQSQPVNQQFVMSPYAPLPTNRSFTTSSNPWDSEASQLESILSETYGVSGLQTPFGSLLNVTTAAPSYDMTWISSSGSNVPAGFTGEAAQFVEDWRFQAAMEGYGLVEQEPDARMTF